VVRRKHYNVLFVHTLPNLLIFIILCFIFKDDADLYNYIIYLYNYIIYLGLEETNKILIDMQVVLWRKGTLSCYEHIEMK